MQLFLQVNQDIDTQFQFWISITFAVLVASFVAGEKLSRIERAVITVLYLSAGSILLSRYLTAVEHVAEALELFDAYGVARPTVATAAGLLRLGLFTVGSLVAAVSVLLPEFGTSRRSASSTL